MSAFAGLLGEGSVVTWEHVGCSSVSTDVRALLKDASQIQATDCSFCCPFWAMAASSLGPKTSCLIPVLCLPSKTSSRMCSKPSLQRKLLRPFVPMGGWFPGVRIARAATVAL